MAEQVDGIVLRELRVRLIRDAAERAAWDGLMEAHHCLGFRSPFGAALRHVAELPGGEWAALLGWSPGAFKVGARERWLGWRFLVFPGFRVPNLASDMEALRGHSVLLAETFVDPALFAETCYLAAGWQEIGETGASAGRREAGGSMAVRRGSWCACCAPTRRRRWAGWTSRRVGAAGRQSR